MATTGAGAIPAAITALITSIAAFTIGSLGGGALGGWLGGLSGNKNKKNVNEGQFRKKGSEKAPTAERANVGETLTNIVFGPEAKADERIPKTEKIQTKEVKNNNYELDLDEQRFEIYCINSDKES